MFLVASSWVHLRASMSKCVCECGDLSCKNDASTCNDFDRKMLIIWTGKWVKFVPIGLNIYALSVSEKSNTNPRIHFGVMWDFFSRSPRCVRYAWPRRIKDSVLRAIIKYRHFNIVEYVLNSQKSTLQKQFRRRNIIWNCFSVMSPHLTKQWSHCLSAEFNICWSQML